jgi:hypothetical protein
VPVRATRRQRCDSWGSEEIAAMIREPLLTSAGNQCTHLKSLWRPSL